MELKPRYQEAAFYAAGEAWATRYGWPGRHPECHANLPLCSSRGGDLKLVAFEEVAEALAAADVRYLVAGGLAVNAHGYLRFTADIDIVVALATDNARAAFNALVGIGYQPSVPVTAAQFGDEATRRDWIEDKGMQVLNFFSDRHPATSVDIFVEEPFDFDAEYERALIGQLSPERTARFVSIPTLIAMKERAARPRDEDDIQHLRWMLEEGSGNV